MNDEKLKNWLSALVQGIVARPEAVVVDKAIDDMGEHYIVTAAPEDMGMVIGRGGQTAEAIRVLLRCAGSRLDVRAALTIKDPKYEKNSSM